MVINMKIKLTKKELKNLTENYKFFRRFALLWAMALITFISFVVFIFKPEISDGTATAYRDSIIILTAVITLYQFLRKKDDEILRKFLLAEKMIERGMTPPDDWFSPKDKKDRRKVGSLIRKKHNEYGDMNTERDDKNHNYSDYEK
jgi:hypothetical protein